MKALIVGENPGALAVVRELGRCGWTVGVGSSRKFGLVSASRWCARRHDMPRPLGDLQHFIESVNAAARAEGYDIVFGAGDAAVLALSANRHKILPLFPYGPDEGVRKGFDKLSLSRLATEFGIPTPRTLPASEQSLESLDGPIAVKSRLHWTPGSDNRRPRVEAVLCRDKENALREAERMRSLGAEPLFQAYVPGRNMVLTILVDQQGSVVAGMAQKEMYEGPWRPMANFRAVTIAIDEDLLQRCQSLLNEIRWFGLSCFQFQMTNDGTPFLIDFNGRAVWDSALASACGMKGHDTWARLAIGAPSPQGDTVFVPGGRYYQDIENDLRHALQSARGPRRIISEIAQFLSYTRKSVHPVFAGDDVLPVVSYFAMIPRRIFLKTKHLVGHSPFIRRTRSRTRH